MEELFINKKVFCVAFHPVKAQLAQETCCARPIRLVAASLPDSFNCVLRFHYIRVYTLHVVS
jgi:hypothetical protein